MLFAKPKTQPDAVSSDDAAAVFKTEAPKGLAGKIPGLGPAMAMAGQGGQVALKFLKTPFVAPALVFVALLTSVGLFIAITGDPSGDSPWVSVGLPKPPAEAGHAPVQAPAADASLSGAQAFSIDSLGLLNDPGPQGFATTDPKAAHADVQGGTAVITLPGGSDTTASVAPARPVTPLAKAPISGISAPSPDGLLPIIAANGMTPSSAYARPFRSDGRPMVALVVGGLGLNATTTRAAIEQLPGEVTLSFVPYTTDLQTWVDLARSYGHEVLIEVPMQPTNFPDNDPGPLTLMANAKTEDLNANLLKTLSRATGYFGVINYQGSAFLKDKVGMGSFMNVLKGRGLTFVDDGQARNVSGAWGRASADRIIDDQITGMAINAQLVGIETTARTHGAALGTGFAYPVTLAVALKWTQGLDKKGLQLAPASAISHR